MKISQWEASAAYYRLTRELRAMHHTERTILDNDPCYEDILTAVAEGRDGEALALAEHIRTERGDAWRRRANGLLDIRVNRGVCCTQTERERENDMPITNSPAVQALLDQQATELVDDIKLQIDVQTPRDFDRWLSARMYEDARKVAHLSRIEQETQRDH